MKKYLLTIDTSKEKDWELFKKAYKKRGLGNNLDEAIMAIIKKEGEKSG